jgi:NB-ARC domain
MPSKRTMTRSDGTPSETFFWHGRDRRGRRDARLPLVTRLLPAPRLREAVLRTADGAVGVTGKPLGFQGEGGIGKTVLAAGLAHDPEVRRHFPDGVFWVTIGASGDLVSAQLELLSRLG